MEALVATAMTFESEASATPPNHRNDETSLVVENERLSGQIAAQASARTPHTRINRARMGAGLRAALSSRASGLLLEYVRLELGAALHSPSCEAQSISEDASASLQKEHVQRISALCIEFCTLLGRMELLAGPIYRAFRRSQLAHSVMLETLEPLLLNQRLPYLSPPMLLHFARQCQIQGRLKALEGCLLRLRIDNMPQTLLIAICSRLRLTHALIRWCNLGAADFHSPIDYLLRQVNPSVLSMHPIDRRERVCRQL